VGGEEIEASISVRATGQRRLLKALQSGNLLDSTQARLLYPGASKLLRDWAERGWIEKSAARGMPSPQQTSSCEKPGVRPELTEEQRQAVASISEVLDHFTPWLLLGVTGSGKTEVYLSLIEKLAAQGRQTLLLVPEINLTPQLEARVQGRFPGLEVVSLHSGLAEGERLARWEKARSARALIVLGTRLAVFTPLPRLGLVIVDEEHDGSFKQNDGLRYHARDLAVYVAKKADVPVLLGSATPSLETYANVIESRYRSVTLSRRPAAAPPTVRFINVREKHLDHGLTEEALVAIAGCISRKEQCLVYINRRGFAPVLLCRACGWMAQCSRCSARLTLHTRSSRLKCHYCGHEERIAAVCPDCGNQDLHGLGQGTQRIEDALRGRLNNAARVLRVDSDSTRRRGAFSDMNAQIHNAEVDVLVGTQMLAKGHDFPKLTLVVIIGADHALYSSDFRAAERLFQQLMQVAGRAGRGELPGQVLVQTEFPDHPVYHALARQDFAEFADELLAERRRCGFPPYVYQAVLRAEAHGENDMWSFLRSAAEKASTAKGEVTVYDCVPAPVFRIAGRYRGQLLIQAATRMALRQFLARWHPLLAEKKTAAVRWAIDVDPVEL
jgi:primosomal protein N' (replication factor Y)